MCKGEAHGDFDLRKMPADANFLNSLWLFAIFLDRGGGTLQKQGGGYQRGCDARTMGRCPLHIPGAQNRGKFLQ
jgi:hypothetical protein